MKTCIDDKRWYLYENQYVQMVFWLRLDYLTYNIVHETESWLRQMDLDTVPYYKVHTLNSDTNYANTISIIYKKDRSMIYYRAFGILHSAHFKNYMPVYKK